MMSAKLRLAFILLLNKIQLMFFQKYDKLPKRLLGGKMLFSNPSFSDLLLA